MNTKIFTAIFVFSLAFLFMAVNASAIDSLSVSGNPCNKDFKTNTGIDYGTKICDKDTQRICTCDKSGIISKSYSWNCFADIRKVCPLALSSNTCNADDISGCVNTANAGNYINYGTDAYVVNGDDFAILKVGDDDYRCYSREQAEELVKSLDSGSESLIGYQIYYNVRNEEDCQKNIDAFRKFDEQLAAARRTDVNIDNIPACEKDVIGECCKGVDLYTRTKNYKEWWEFWVPEYSEELVASYSDKCGGAATGDEGDAPEDSDTKTAAEDCLANPPCYVADGGDYCWYDNDATEDGISKYIECNNEQDCNEKFDTCINSVTWRLYKCTIGSDTSYICSNEDDETNKKILMDSCTTTYALEGVFSDEKQCTAAVPADVAKEGTKTFTIDDSQQSCKDVCTAEYDYSDYSSEYLDSNNLGPKAVCSADDPADVQYGGSTYWYEYNENGDNTCPENQYCYCRLEDIPESQGDTTIGAEYADSGGVPITGMVLAGAADIAIIAEATEGTIKVNEAGAYYYSIQGKKGRTVPSDTIEKIKNVFKASKGEIKYNPNFGGNFYKTGPGGGFINAAAEAKKLLSKVPKSRFLAATAGRMIFFGRFVPGLGTVITVGSLIYMVYDASAEHASAIPIDANVEKLRLAACGEDSDSTSTVPSCSKDNYGKYYCNEKKLLLCKYAEFDNTKYEYNYKWFGCFTYSSEKACKAACKAYESEKCLSLPENEPVPVAEAKPAKPKPDKKVVIDDCVQKCGTGKTDKGNWKSMCLLDTDENLEWGDQTNGYDSYTHQKQCDRICTKNSAYGKGYRFYCAQKEEAAGEKPEDTKKPEEKPDGKTTETAESDDYYVCFKSTIPRSINDGYECKKSKDCTGDYVKLKDTTYHNEQDCNDALPKVKQEYDQADCAGLGYDECNSEKYKSKCKYGWFSCKARGTCEWDDQTLCETDKNNKCEWNGWEFWSPCKVKTTTDIYSTDELKECSDICTTMYDKNYVGGQCSSPDMEPQEDGYKFTDEGDAPYCHKQHSGWDCWCKKVDSTVTMTDQKIGSEFYIMGDSTGAFTARGFSAYKWQVDSYGNPYPVIA
jgi:hypothetical protein